MLPVPRLTSQHKSSLSKKQDRIRGFLSSALVGRGSDPEGHSRNLAGAATWKKNRKKSTNVTDGPSDKWKVGQMNGQTDPYGGLKSRAGHVLSYEAKT